MSNLSFGPTGGHGGDAFENYVLPDGARLREIHVSSGWYVDAIQFIYVDATGQLEAMPNIGGRGERHEVFALGEDEYLTGISGRSGRYVDSIQFHTHKRTSPRYGGGGGENEYELFVDEGQEVIGLFGRSGWYIDALGILGRNLAKAAPPAAAVAPKKAAAPSARPATRAKTAKQKTPAKAKKAAVPSDVVAEPKPADLQKVEGIGPKIADILVGAGVSNLDALAATPVEQLKVILSGAGRRFAMADPTTWPAQAKLAAAGDVEGLKVMQATLKAGRKV